MKGHTRIAICFGLRRAKGGGLIEGPIEVGVDLSGEPSACGVVLNEVIQLAKTPPPNPPHPEEWSWANVQITIDGFDPEFCRDLALRLSTINRS